MKVATAGQCVNSASSAIAGSSRSQPWIVAVTREFMGSLLYPLVPAKAGTQGQELDSRLRGNERERATNAPLPVLLQNPLRLGLSVLHGLLSGLGAGECRLDAVVERLGDALVLVGRELRHRGLELVARDRGGWEIRDVFLHRLRFVRVGAYRHIAGVDAPLCGAFWRRYPFDKLEGGGLLGGARLL